jgi:hypothetical protein
MARRRTFSGPWAGASIVFIACAVLTVLSAAACVPARTSSTTASSERSAAAAPIRGATTDPSLADATITRDGNDVYDLTSNGGVVTASAPATNVGGNTRIVFWRAGELDSFDQISCASWIDAPAGIKQQGAVLRARTSGGRTTAITVTQNIYYGAWWGFNIHVMDSAAAEPFHQIGSFELKEIFRPSEFEAPPYPWRMCARVVGNVVSFIVWPTTHAKPAWDDARYGASVTLPSGWGAAGKPGWYMGHLEPGKWAGFADLSIVGLRPDQSRASQPVATAELSKPATPPVPPTWIAKAP